MVFQRTVQNRRANSVRSKWRRRNKKKREKKSFRNKVRFSMGQVSSTFETLIGGAQRFLPGDAQSFILQSKSQIRTLPGILEPSFDATCNKGSNLPLTRTKALKENEN